MTTAYHTAQAPPSNNRIFHNKENSYNGKWAIPNCNSCLACHLLSNPLSCAVLSPVWSVVPYNPLSRAVSCSLQPLVYSGSFVLNVLKEFVLLKQFVSILMVCFHYRGFPHKANSFQLTDIYWDAGCLINCITSTNSLTTTPRDMVTSSYCYGRLVGKYFISEKGK